ncbi:MAG: sugar phosphate isomerase/epimerase [Planctomycetota bacterium]|nr:MAG: sugar phosphate isomerase/epimerase [Planctomycetota bacterium]
MATMIKGINLWTFDRKTSIAEAAKAAREAGFEAIEPTLEAKGKLTPKTTEAKCRELGQTIRDAGLQIASLACGLFWETSYASPDPKVREQAYQLTIAGLDRARWIGSPVLLVVPGVVRRAKTKTLEIGYADALAFSCDMLKNLAYEAATRGVIVAIENVWDNILISPVETREFIDRINSPWVGVYFDVGNVMRYGVPQDWITTLAQRIVRVHLKDFQLDAGNRNGFCSLGEGDVDWAAVVAALQSIGYQGPLTYEGPGEPADISSRIDRILKLL